MDLKVNQIEEKVLKKINSHNALESLPWLFQFKNNKKNQFFRA